ncbi:hypothetical protein ACNKHR_10395 [Shigella flexneri]
MNNRDFIASVVDRAIFSFRD